MKLIYVANIRVPTEKAHGIQIMEMCQAFSIQGHEVELVVRDTPSDIKEDPFDFYDIEPIFRLSKIWCLNTVGWGRLGFLLESLTFSISALIYVWSKKAHIYTRDEMVAVLMKVFGRNVTLETHMGHKNILIKILIYLGNKIVVINESLKDLYTAMGLRSENVLVAHDGADVDRFDLDINQKQAREKLNLPTDKKIILYKGSLIKWKGVGTLLDSAELLQHKDALVVVIGGKPEEVEELRRDYAGNKNILIAGRVPRKQTPIYQKSADILVIPNSAKEDISKLYTSPMKLFGYMAGNVPIVASDLPSLREILNESRAYFFSPDDSLSLAKTLDFVLGHFDEARVKALKSLEEVREYSWKKRASKIIDFIQ